MALFGLGSAVPLLLLGLLSRHQLLRWRGTLMRAGGGLKAAMGVVLVVMAGAMLLGLDKTVEAALVEASPAWLADLTTRF